MSTIEEGYRGAWLLLQINTDRILSVALLAAALYAGAWISQ